jgi:CBS domain-containing membrane protein
MAPLWHGPQFLQLPLMAERHSRRLVFTVFVAAAGGISIALITAVAFWTNHPLVVPSLGPTAFLVFNRSQSQVSRPRNIVFGHLIGALSGFAALAAFGLLQAPAVTEGGLSASRIGAAALSIALTSGVMILADAEHGPAAATTLIVSLGFIRTLEGLALLMAGVVALALEGVLIDRFVGLDLPLWSDRRLPPPGPSRRGQLILLPSRRRQIEHSEQNGARVAENVPVRQDNSGSYVIGSHEGRLISTAQAQTLVKLEGLPVNAPYSLLEVCLEPHPAVPLIHVHTDFTESYVVLEGVVSGHVGNEQVRAGAGSVVWVPRGVPHALYNKGRDPARFFAVTTHSRQSNPEFIL